MRLCILVFLLMFSSVSHASDDEIDVSGGRITGLNDPLESRVMLEVRDVDSHFKQKLYMFRGFIDKETLETQYQIYFRIKGYAEAGWNNAKMLVNGKAHDFKTSTISKKTECNRYGCFYTEDAIAHIDRESLNYMTTEERTIRLFSGISTSREELDLDEKDAKNFAEAMDKIVNFLRNAKDKQKVNSPIVIEKKESFH